MNPVGQVDPGPKPRRTLKELIASVGPGIIVVLTWIGAGDLVDASIAGAHYGYDLMWVLALSLIIRFVIVNVMSRYQLCNNEGISLLEGFTRLHRFYPYFLGAYGLLMGHLFNSYMIKGSGEALSHLLGFGHPFVWAIIVVISAVIFVGKSFYSRLENFMKVLLAIMTISFLVIAIWSTPSVGEIAKGTIGFGIPSDVGLYGAFLIAISLTGAVSGSVANFIYPYFMKDKGWTSPLHKRAQRNDLLFAICMAIVLDLAVWIVGAEILRPNGIEISNIDDLAQTLAITFGQFGYIIFYLGVLGALYSSVVGFATGFPKLIVDSLQTANPERRAKYAGDLERDPLFKWSSLFIIISPIVWSIPGMPGFISLVVFVNVLSVVGLPVISIGLLILSNQKSKLGKYRNNWFENFILIACTILAIWSSLKLFIGFFS
ncbi:Nramp family divalent metal transporter [Ammoniphilus resinae]|nr:Nramp family divalent metal transporter [Ammoniphilus resinae]